MKLNYPKTVLGILPLLFLLFSFRAPEQASGPAWLKPGAKLIYAVEYNASEYRMTVNVKELSPVFKFSFSISDPHSTKGNVNISRDALDSCTKIISTFAAGQTELMDQTVLVLSKKLFHIAETQDRLPPIDMDGYYVEMTRSPQQASLTMKVKGKEEKQQTISLASAADQPEFNNSMIVLNNADFPLILSLSAKWKLKLLEVK
jgi:hypothetical protein